jgi:hypothetical protein
MANIMRSTDFRSIVEPIMNKEFDGIYEDRKDEYAQVFKTIAGVPRNYHEVPFLYGFQAAQEVPDGQAFAYDAAGVQFMQRFVYKVYGMAFALTKVLIEDGDHIRIGQLYSQHLAKSMIETKETLCANVLNRGFNASYPGGDSVALFSSSHPSVGGANQSNILATAANLSQTSLEQMLIQIRQANDPRGKKIRLTPKKLTVSPSNYFQAQVLLRSVLRTGTANNDVNPVKGELDETPAILSRLTSSTAFFVTTDAPQGLMLVTRKGLEKSMEGDFETDSMRYKARERYATGFVDFRGAYGTAGV